MDDPWSHLQAFIREVRAPSLFGLDAQLTRDMDLYHDLDWEPARIASVMRAWAARFDVDLGDFTVEDYVPSASMRRRDVMWAALKAPFSAAARDALGGRALTLGMLEAVMRDGKWSRE